MITTKNSPCINCTKRHLACHDTCEEYKGYQVKIKEYKKKVNNAKREKQRVDDFIYRRLKSINEARKYS